MPQYISGQDLGPLGNLHVGITLEGAEYARQLAETRQVTEDFARSVKEEYLEIAKLSGDFNLYRGIEKYTDMLRDIREFEAYERSVDPFTLIREQRGRYQDYDELERELNSAVTTILAWNREQGVNIRLMDLSQEAMLHMADTIRKYNEETRNASKETEELVEPLTMFEQAMEMINTQDARRELREYAESIRVLNEVHSFAVDLSGLTVEQTNALAQAFSSVKEDASEATEELTKYQAALAAIAGQDARQAQREYVDNIRTILSAHSFGVDLSGLSEDQIRVLAEALEVTDSNTKSTEELANSWDLVNDASLRALRNIIRYAEDLKDVLSFLLRAFAETFLVAGFERLTESIAGLQYGGSAYANQPYLVGERGPELFVPRQSGTVVPNGMGTSGTTVVNNFNTPANDTLAPLIRQQIQEATAVMEQRLERNLAGRLRVTQRGL